jgi:hypothetical protein
VLGARKTKKAYIMYINWIIDRWSDAIYFGSTK